MKYTANPVEVEAFKITNVDKAGEPPRATLTLEDGHGFTCDEGMTARYWPKVGDYLVEQADGYKYLNPKDVFERKYSPAFDMEALQKLRKASP